ncbi:shikimate kinase [Flavisolibacter ginsengisoli]|jgi:shikimate kinase|nr:shikimate kinase [Flavisolibacter ginsengisoli]
MKIFLIGFMGCGKTHWGKELSMKLSIPFFDLDEKIAEQAGKEIPQIFSENGEEHFRLLEKEILYMLTESHETFVMSCGGGTPCYYNNIDYLKKKGTVVWLNCSVDCLYHRLIKEKDKRPLIRDVSDDKLKSFIIKKFSNRKIFYQQANIIINDDEVSIDKLIERIFHEQ